MLNTARKLSRSQWRYLLKSFVWLPAIDLHLRARGLENTKRRLAALATPAHNKTRAHPEVSMACAMEIATAIAIAGRRHFWKTSCLRQALLLKYFLARRGASCDLEIGVRRDDGGALDAHAWVSYRGQVILGGEQSPERYRRFSFPHS
jgi:hypothetical protein